MPSTGDATSPPRRRCLTTTASRRGPGCEAGRHGGQQSLLHARSLPFRCAGRFMPLVVAGGCVAAVLLFGELSVGALLAVGGTGVLITVVGLARRSGEAAPPVGRRGRPWLGWLTAAAAWELLSLVHDEVPTFSDLADPVLAHPPVRGAATLGWLLAGAWLIARPHGRGDLP